MKSMDNPHGEVVRVCNQAEEALRETQAILKAALDNSQVGIAIVDARSGALKYVNEAGLLIRGSDCQSVADGIGIEQYMAGWQMMDLDRRPLKPDEVPLRAIMSGEASCREFIIRRTSDGERMVLANAAPIRDDNGKVVAGIIVFIDITERMRADAENAKLEAQLQQAMKMESVGRLAGGVAHDFNNMLGIIIGHAELAMREMVPTNPLHAHLEEICKAANRSADLTRQLLAFARRQTVAPKVLYLNETVEGMLKMLRRLIGENIDLGWQPKTNLWPVKVDPSQIDQILANLCVNAQDAISGVGKIIIETGNCILEKEYCSVHAGFTPGEYVMLTVSDDGCGMDKKTVTNIFEPFFTTKEMGKGTGLGLATVYGIVKQNEGFINVYSEPGLGTRFSIYLPRHKGKAVPLPQEALAKPVARGNETILLVEDESAILTLITMMLTKLGYTVLTACTPGEIIRLAGEHAGEIHLLMTDVVMPEMNGRDLAGNLLSRYPHIRHLFMSGYTADVIAHNGILDDGVNFIQKPFSMKELAAKVREALGECTDTTR